MALAKQATGGTITYVNGEVVHTFTSNGTFVVPSDGGEVRVLIVGGGGGGGNDGGGGGAGGVIHTLAYSVNQGSIEIVIGAGGGVSTNGANSSFGALIGVRI